MLMMRVDYGGRKKWVGGGMSSWVFSSAPMMDGSGWGDVSVGLVMEQS